jgi:hypothetical protein
MQSYPIQQNSVHQPVSVLPQCSQEFQFSRSGSRLVSEITEELILMKQVVEFMGRSTRRTALNRYEETNIGRNFLHSHGHASSQQRQSAARGFTCRYYSGGDVLRSNQGGDTSMSSEVPFVGRG